MKTSNTLTIPYPIIAPTIPKNINTPATMAKPKIQRLIIKTISLRTIPIK